MLSLHPHVRVWIVQAGRSLRRCCGKNHLIKLHVVRFRRDCVDKLHADERALVLLTSFVLNITLICVLIFV